MEIDIQANPAFNNTKFCSVSPEITRTSVEMALVITIIKRRKWSWIGHALGKPQETVSSVALECDRGKRDRNDLE